jgi:hypothetical protein
MTTKSVSPQVSDTLYLNNKVSQYGHRVFAVFNRKPDEDSIYIGRGKGSILGNPFMTGSNKTLQDRKDNCIKYRNYLSDMIKTNSNPEMLAQIKALKDKNVVCFCSNGTSSVEDGAQYCHGHIILSASHYLCSLDEV